MTDRNYGAIREAELVSVLVDKLVATGKPFAFDIEAGYVGEDKEKVALMQYHPDYRLTGISFTNSSQWARYVPIAHDDDGNVDDVVSVARSLWKLLRTGLGVGHNIAYEIKGMSRWFRETLWDDPEVGAEVRESRGMFKILADTMLMVWLAAEFHPLKVGKDLKSVAEAAFGIKMTHFEDLFPYEDTDMGPAIKKGKIRFARFNTRNSRNYTVISYACEDSAVSFMLWERYQNMLNELIYKTETALIPTLVKMETGPVDSSGTAIGNMVMDWKLVRRKSEEIQRFATLMGEEILQNLSERLGRVVSINLGSTKQLAGVLFERAPLGLGLPVKVRSDKTGDPSTSDDALKGIAQTDPVIRKILQYRQVIKLNSAYLAKFLKDVSYSGTGYVFPNHNQFGALTGRMSVDHVSYQQWPKPYHFELDSGLSFDLNFRDLFISPEDYRIVGFDYANVEMRIAGAMSGEMKIVDAFNNGMDLHKSTAAATFHVPFDEVTKKQRQAAKTLNFAILYGSGPANIAEMLSTPAEPMSKDEAQDLLDRYLEGYPDLAKWIRKQQIMAREQKYVTTYFGRKYTTWDHYDPRGWVREKGDRMAVNAPIQGTAADIIKIAMVRVQAAIERAGLTDLIRMTLTVHDALEFLVHKSVSTQQVIDLLDPQVNFPIPGFPLEIRADWHEGYQWGAVAEVSLDENQKVSKYVMEYELPWSKEAFKWEGATLHEALDPYYVWENTRFGTACGYYQKRNPDFCLVPEEQVVPAEEAPLEDLAESQQVTVVTVGMPDSTQWGMFLDYLRTVPGIDRVTVEMPDGQITPDGRYSIPSDDYPAISLMLGGASVVVSSLEDVDADLVISL